MKCESVAGASTSNTLVLKRWPDLKASSHSWFRRFVIWTRTGLGHNEIEKLRSALSPAEKRRLVKDARFGVDWIYEVAKEIAEQTA